MELTKFEKARLLFNKVLEENVETEVLQMLREHYDPNKLEYEVLYDTGDRSFMLRPLKGTARGQIVVGVVVDDIAISLREGMMTCNWNQAREYCRLDNCNGAEMTLPPADLHLERIFDGLSAQFEYLGGDPLSFGWYWTDHKINEEQALAVEMRTGMLKAFNVKANLRYRPCYHLLPNRRRKSSKLFFAFEEDDG